MCLGAVGAHADDADAGLGQRLDFLDVGVQGTRAALYLPQTARHLANLGGTRTLA